MKKRLLSMLAVAATVLMFAGCGGSAEAPPETDFTGADDVLLGVWRPNRELYYGQAVYLKSANWQNYLSGRSNTQVRMMLDPQAMSDPEDLETWFIMDPTCNCASRNPVLFNGKVLLRSWAWQRYLSAARFGAGVTLVTSPNTAEVVFNLIDPAQPQSTRPVKVDDRALIRSARGDYLSAGSKGNEAAVLMAKDAKELEQWYINQLGSTRNSSWMAEMESDLRDVPLTKGIIPGSHDAGTYSIADDATFSPDLPLEKLSDLKELLLERPKLAPRVNYHMARFARAQTSDIRQQLFTGVRYFDLRPGASNNGQGTDLLVVHSLYGGDLLKMIDDIAIFLEWFPKEIVILDFSHHTAMSDRHHEKLISYITETFGAKLVPRPANASQEDPKANGYTFGDIWDNGWQVVALYQSDYAGDETKLWRYGTPSPNDTSWWPNKPTTDKVKAHLDELLATKRPQLKEGALFVLQTVLTGDAELYAKAVVKLEDPIADLHATLNGIQDTLSSLQQQVNDGQGDINTIDKNIDSLKNAINGKQNDIDSNQRWIDGHPYFWDYPGRKLREGWIWKLKGEIAALQFEILALEKTGEGYESALTTANDAITDAKKQITDLQQEIDNLAASLVNVPTSLAELAAQGNPTMLGWLEAWRDKGLNIIIRDTVDLSFVDKVRLLNKKN